MPRAKAARTPEEKLSILEEAAEAMQASSTILLNGVASDVITGGADHFLEQAHLLLDKSMATQKRFAQLKSQSLMLQQEEMVRSARSQSAAGDRLREAFSE